MKLPELHRVGTSRSATSTKTPQEPAGNKEKAPRPAPKKHCHSWKKGDGSTTGADEALRLLLQLLDEDVGLGKAPSVEVGVCLR